MQGNINLDMFYKNIDLISYKVQVRAPINRSIYYMPDKGYESCKNRTMAVSQLGIQVTEACNLRCTYCYQLKKRPKTITFEQGKRIIDIVLGLIPDEEKEKFAKFDLRQPFMFHMIGGESFLYPELCYNLIKYFDTCLKENNIELEWYSWIPTNGLNYDNEYIQKMINEFGDKLHLQISVDGCEECHNACRVDANGKGSYDLSNHAFQEYRKTSEKLRTITYF